MKSAKPKERKEKLCLNCHTELHGLYCHVCGQKNVEPRRPLWEIPWAFIEDMINVDGKFFKSLKHLLFSPGYLSKVYIEGKRQNYNDPVRMYLVTSFIFFIVTAIVFNRFKAEIDVNASEAKIENRQEGDSTNRDRSIHYNTKKQSGISYNFSTTDDTLNTKESTLEGARIMKEMVDNIKTYLPYLLWISLPLYALILKLLYIRRKIFYWDHLVFSIVNYSFHFLLLSFGFLVFYFLTWIFKEIDQELLSRAISTLVILAGSVYVFMSLKKFYGQKIIKTLIKLILMNTVVFFLFIFLLVVLIAVTSA